MGGSRTSDLWFLYGTLRLYCDISYQQILLRRACSMCEVVAGWISYQISLKPRLQCIVKAWFMNSGFFATVLRNVFLMCSIMRSVVDVRVWLVRRIQQRPLFISASMIYIIFYYFHISLSAPPIPLLIADGNRKFIWWRTNVISLFFDFVRNRWG